MYMYIERSIRASVDAKTESVITERDCFLNGRAKKGHRRQEFD